MALVHSRTGSGLLLAEEGADAASISRALRQLDPELRLQPEFSQTLEATVWKVYRYAGDRPMEFVLAFVNDRGEPYPLSSRLLDMVRAQDRNTRHRVDDEDTLNARNRAERDRNVERFQEDLRDDMLGVGATVLPRSTSLRMSRDKRRARGEKV